MSNESVNTIRIHCVIPEGKTIEEASTNLKTAFQVSATYISLNSVTRNSSLQH